MSMAFFIVSSDSDFIGLACRIKEAGLAVYGFGTSQTARAFRIACNEFVLTDTPPLEFAAISF